jgi:hypothetical protein
MAFTPDPETTWSAGFAGALANPGVKIDLSGLIGKFDYNAAVYSYQSIIGVERGFEFNPVSLLGLLGPNKKVSGIASFVGNYEVQVSEYMTITLGNNLSLERSRISFSTNREYRTGVKAVVSAILIVMALADIAVVYGIRYGLNDNDSGAKLFVGIQQGVYSVSLIVLHYLETIGVEADAKLRDLVDQLNARITNLNIFITNNSNLVDILNPLLTNNRIQNLINIANSTLASSKKAIKMANDAIKVTVVQAAPIPNPGGGGGCWVARAVYGPENPRWILFRKWLFGNGPNLEARTFLQRLYLRHGQSFARIVERSLILRKSMRIMMDLVLWTNRRNIEETCNGQQSL